MISVEVRMGWSGEAPAQVAQGGTKPPWVKFDVTVDEHDLARLCSEHGLDPAQLTTLQAYQLQALECEHLVIITSTKYTGTEGKAEQVEQNRAQFSAVVGQIKKGQEAARDTADSTAS